MSCPVPTPDLRSPVALRILTVVAYRTDQELAISIKKATNSDEISPKRKHVRACIVYTWDHRSSVAFWSGIKVYGAPAAALRHPRSLTD